MKRGTRVAGRPRARRSHDSDALTCRENALIKGISAYGPARDRRSWGFSEPDLSGLDTDARENKRKCPKTRFYYERLPAARLAAKRFAWMASAAPPLHG